ncbi:protein of unknown function DUF81 [Gloeothece citriformis PCC 7424]|uniref:Probable membrane transporter protein n=1 Tax=Gloeothece citriformis (strain PCC 7424) TaxID=65393 RepID=B7KFI1_GLOC7|nr:sulfite exporter TauE/SafE family protein [Gloeothece citriformis]ACK73306.1 protein of unknown function DUF81 [Gloeothece citriformis PCC 7424]
MLSNWLIFLLGGLFSGGLAGLLGIGGGTVLVPLLIAIHQNQSNYQPVNAVATSLLAIVITSISGSIQNWRMGYLDIKRVIYIAIPSLFTAQLGAYLANLVPDYILLGSFAVLLIATIFLTNLRKRLASRTNNESSQNTNLFISYLIIGGSGGLLAGFFGVGGGVIMVPLQMLLIKENIKKSVQTSLGIIVVTSIAACAGHAWQGNVKFLEGFLLGIGGLIGAQISTRFLPKLPDKVVSFLFRTLLAILSVYFFWKAWIAVNQ